MSYPNMCDVYNAMALLAFDMNLIGSEAAEKDGIAWTITHMDHPSARLLSKAIKASMGTTTLVGLSRKTVS